MVRFLLMFHVTSRQLFEPQVIREPRDVSGIEDKVMSMYAGA